MALKVFILAFLALQGITNAKEIGVKSEKGVQEDLEQIIESIRKLIQDSIDNIIAVINNFYEEINTAIQNAINNVNAEIDKIKQEILEEIKNIEEQAEHMGLEIKKCIDEQKSRIDALMAQTEDNLKQCVQKTLQEADEVHKKVLAFANDAFTTMSSILKEFNECPDLVCKIRVVSKATEEIERLDIDFKVVRQETIEFLQNAIPNLLTCIAGEVMSFRNESAKIISDIQECIQE